MAGGQTSYLSPISKLLRFFHRSRDNWKAKCKTAKRENKSLKQRLAKMTESRDRWKARAQELATGVESQSPQEGAKKGVGLRPRGGGRRRA